jgi:hypothetical protein
LEDGKPIIEVKGSKEVLIPLFFWRSRPCSGDSSE